MQIDAQYCLARCCHFLDGGPVTREEYETVVRRLANPPGPTAGNSMAIREVVVPCQNILLHKTVGQRIGYYVGQPGGGIGMITKKVYCKPNIYDAKTRQYLRPATEQDLKKWNDAIEVGVRCLAN